MEFLDIFQAGGPIMIPLLFISILAVAFAVERAMAFRQFGTVVPTVSAEVLELVKSGREQEALRLADETPGPVAANLAVIIRNRHHSIDDMERRANVTTEEYFIRLERFLPAIDTFTTLSPLLGLLGTILGMVRVFQQFSSAGSDEGKAHILSGVGESLYATAFGITIAVFSFAIYNYFSSRQRVISLDAEQGCQRLLAYYHGKKVAAGEGVAETTRRRGVTASKGREIKETKIEIIPMIDTMFFLLVFFILSSLGIIKLQGQKVDLPQATNSEKQKPAQITVSISAKKTVKINIVEVPDGADVGPYLKQEVEKQIGKQQGELDKAVVVLSADTNVPNGIVVKTIDQARAVGISHFAIATAPKAPPPGAADASPTTDNP